MIRADFQNLWDGAGYRFLFVLFSFAVVDHSALYVTVFNFRFKFWNDPRGCACVTL